MGISQFGAHSKNGIEDIDLSTLYVKITIPLLDKPGRGLAFQPFMSLDESQLGGITAGWLRVSQNITGMATYENVGIHCVGHTHWTYTDTYGIKHGFGLSVGVGLGNCGGTSTATGLAGDGSGLTMTVSYGSDQATLTAANGATWTVPVALIGDPYLPNGARQDSNGNTITVTSNSITDTLGQVYSIVGDGSAGYNTDGGAPPPSGSLSYYDSNGILQTITINYGVFNVNNPGLAVCDPGYLPYPQGSFNLITSIVLANGTSYGFAYEPGPSGTTTGRLSQLTLPTGGTITYTYSGGNGGYLCDFGAIVNSIASMTRTTSDGTWTYTRSLAGQDTSTYPTLSRTVTTTVIDPQGNTTAHTFMGYSLGPLDFHYLHTSTTAYQGNATGTPLLLSETCYNGFVRPCANETEAGMPNNDSSFTSTDNYTTRSGQTSRTSVTYGNTNAYLSTEIDEYDYGAASPTRKTLTQYLTLNGILTDKLQSVIVKDQNDNVKKQSQYGYDETSVAPTSGVPQHAAIAAGQRGNLTSDSVWRNTDDAWLRSSFTNDDTGNRITSTDALGNPSTRYAYTDSWYSGTSSCNVSNANAFLTQVTDPLGHVTKFAYDSCTGLRRQEQSPNDLAANRIGTLLTSDLMGKQTLIQTADGGNTATSYGGYALPLTITKTTLATPNPSIVKAAIADGYGRTIREKTTSDPSGTVYVDTIYDALGRVFSVSNPYRSTSDATYGVTRHWYDALGREVIQTQPDFSVLQWCYDGIATAGQTNCASNASSVTAATWIDASDEVGMHTQSASDGFGRLRSVIEPDPLSGVLALETDYSYDLLNNLTSAIQIGKSGETARTRSSIYDSISQLITSYNPETGYICYGTSPNGTPPNASNCTSGYDSDGNLRHKTDARDVQTDYTFDALNRITLEQAPGIYHLYGYDSWSGAATNNGIGQLVWASNTVNADEVFSYDPLGRLNWQASWTPSSPNHSGIITTAAYDLAGNMTDLTYPDGRHIHQAWDGAGQISSSSLVDIGGVANSQSYLQSVVYHPDGTPKVLTLGNGVQQTIGKNQRLQTQTVVTSSPLAPFNGQTFLSRAYCYVNCPSGGTANNGNIWQVADTLSSTRTQDFTYDSLNRLAGFSLGGTLNQQFSIDSFGNMSPLSGGQPVSTFDPATNRINNLPCAGVATAYDATGNQTCDTNSSGAVRQYGFDSEDNINQITVLGGSSPFVSYVYDANGTRVAKNNADGTYTEYVHFDGLPIAEKDQDGNWTDRVYANGQQIAETHSTDEALHLHGTAGCTNCQVYAVWFLTGAYGYTVQPGDKISWRQYQTTTVTGGLSNIWFYGYGGFHGVEFDTDGQQVQQGSAHNVWQQRTFDLTAYVGSTIQTYSVGTSEFSAPGDWDIWITDMVLYRADGAVIPIYTRQPQNPAYLYTASNMTNYSATNDTVNVPANASTSQMATTYITSDHLGSAQTQFAPGGWPLWQGYFAPYGQELTAQPSSWYPATPATDNTHKFTGKERDTESGNDYLGARYYASTTGRFMSPDWSDDPVSVPYASLNDPQSLNLYSYARNNPISNMDLDGHTCDKDAVVTTNNPDSKTTNVTVTAGQCDTVVHEIMTASIGLLTRAALAIYKASNAASNAAQQASDLLSQVDWQKVGCVGNRMLAGGGAGAATGAVGGAVGGAITGPGEVVTVPGGALIGSVIGAGGAGMSATSSCAGGGGGGEGKKGGSKTGAKSKFDPRDAAHQKMTAQEIISQFKKGSITSEFPSEYLPKTFNEIDREAKQGVDAAQTARKLLTDSRFNK